MTFHLAQLNVARLSAPLDDPVNDEFVRALGPINALAEASPGFVWRLADDSGDGATDIRLPGHDDDRTIINLTVWEDLESLRHFTYRSGHGMYLRRKREWFEVLAEAHLVAWWIPAGHIPTIEEAAERLEFLRTHGSGPEAFNLAKPYTPRGAPVG